MKYCGRCHQEMVDYMVVCPVCGNFMTDTMKSKGYTYSSRKQTEEKKYDRPSGTVWNHAAVEKQNVENKIFAEKIERLNGMLQVIEGNLRERERESAQITLQIESIRKEIQQHEKQIRKLAWKIFGRKKAALQTEELHAEIMKLKEKISELDENKEMVESVISQLRDEKANVQQDVTELKNKMR